MLPDFYSIKKKIQEALTLRMKNHAARTDDFTVKIPYTVCHEGSSNRLIRADGTESKMNPRQARAEVKVSNEEFKTMKVTDVLRTCDEMADQILEQQHRTLYEAVEKTCESTGNVIKEAGKITPETVIKMYETVTLGFYDDGTPHQMTIVCGNDAPFKKVLQRIKGDPELSQRLEAIIRKQKREWHVREAKGEGNYYCTMVKIIA